jgi:hypothetical protein
MQTYRFSIYGEEPSELCRSVSVSSESDLAEARRETRESWAAALRMIRETVETLWPLEILPWQDAVLKHCGPSRCTKQPRSWMRRTNCWRKATRTVPVPRDFRSPLGFHAFVRISDPNIR